MELAKGAFYHIHTPYSSPSQALPTSRFLSPHLSALSLFLLVFCSFHSSFTSKSLSPSLHLFIESFTPPRLTKASHVLRVAGTSVTDENMNIFMSFISLSLHHRGGGHPEGDEGEGGGDKRHTRHHALSHAQQHSGQGRRHHHPAAAGHHLHPRTGQAQRQSLLAPSYRLPRQVKQILTVMTDKSQKHWFIQSHTQKTHFDHTDTDLMLKHSFVLWYALFLQLKLSTNQPTSSLLLSDLCLYLPNPVARCVYVCVSQWVTHPSLWS